MRKAILFGATGLVGGYLTKLLLDHPAWDEVTVISRRSLAISHAKLNEVIDPLTDIDKVRQHICGDDLFICLGTTIKKAGSREVFSATDLSLPAAIATTAATNGVRTCAVVSSIGANAGSSNFYLSVKGKMEAAMEKAGFEHLYIFRPSMLLGHRTEKRPAEKAGQIIMQAMTALFIGPLRKYKAVQAKDVAVSMMLMAISGQESCVIESDQIEQLAKKAP